MPNIILALNLLGSLLTQALSIGSAIASAQASGTDLTSDQVTSFADDAQTSLTKLASDITAAKAAGK